MTQYEITINDEDVYTVDLTAEPTPPELGGEWLLGDGTTIELNTPPDENNIEVRNLDMDDGEEVETSEACQQPYGYHVECVMSSGKVYNFYSKTPIAAPNPSPARWVRMDFATDFKLSADRKSWLFLKNKTTAIFLNPAQMSEWKPSPMSKPPGCP